MSLKDTIGQERAVRILLGGIRRDRIPSAVLFSGEGGVGKRLTAMNYAKAVNCLQPVNGDSCDSCISCHKIDSGSHPDLFVVVPEGDEIRIEEVRKIEDALSLRPLEGRRKVVVMDGADAMNIYAANAFLKTLEEPPQDSLIILVSSDPDSLPDTIRSRCIAVRFRSLSSEGCREIVSRLAPGEDHQDLFGLSMGRPGLILSGDLKRQKERFFEVLREMRQAGKDAWEDRLEIGSSLDMASLLVRDLVVREITGERSSMILGYEAVAERDIPELLEAYDSLQSVSGRLDFNLNKSITWNYTASIVRSLFPAGVSGKA
ncbi:MAG: DNA polymerase III subunit delta' [Nitrospirales bacterium]|nr:DNA polymerase III subunit delta' [Nitrospirales bacterium]